VLLPRLLSPQFGLLDDGVALRSVQSISQNWLSAFHLLNDTGRFFPVYWLYNFLIYQVGGANPFLYFVANYLALASITAGVIWFVRYRGGSRFQAWAAGMFLVLSGPTIETYYTLSKAEVPQLLCLMMSLLIITRYTPTTNRQKKFMVIMLTTVTLLLALLSKETSLAILPISVGWLIVGLLRFDAAEDKMGLATRKAFLLANLLAVGIFFMLRSALVTVPTTQGLYTDAYRFELSQMLTSVTRWVAYFIRDFPYLLPFGIFAVATFVLKAQRQARLLLDAAVWMLIWMGIFFPWHTLVEYYLMPFTIGCAIFSGVILGQAVTALSTSQTKLLRGLAGFSLITCLVMIPILLANNMTNAQYQLTLDRANSDLVDYLATLPANSTVLINTPINEYGYELGVLLADLKQRPDIRMDYFRSQIPMTGTESISYYVVTPWIENQLFPSVRYNLYESGARQWNLYLRNFLGDRLALANFSPSVPAAALKDVTQPIHQIEHQFQTLDIGLQLFVCLFANRANNVGIDCDIPRPFIDNRTLSYGWKIYHASRDINQLARPGMYYPDGTWELFLPNGEIRRSHFGQSGDRPIVGDWDGDGASEIGVFNPNDVVWKLDNNLDGQPDVEFQFTGMTASDIPITGDWDGNGTSTPGFFRSTDGSWHLRNSNSNGGEDWPVFIVGPSTDMPLVGDWDGDGRDTAGIYRPQTGEVNLMNSLTAQPVIRYFPIQRQSIPVVADWAGNGSDSITVVTSTTWLRSFVNCSYCEPSQPNPSFEFGAAQGVPVAGKWKVQP
jgi:hypothetical protein